MEETAGGKSALFWKATKVLLWLFWMGVIYFLSSQSVPPASGINWQDFIIKKTAHILFYFVLTVLTYLVLPSRINNRARLYLSLAWCVFYGITDELHQGFTPGREPHVRDVIFDGFGGIIAIWLINRLKTFPSKN